MSTTTIKTTTTNASEIATFLLTDQHISLDGCVWIITLETALQGQNKEFDIGTMVHRIAEPDDNNDKQLEIFWYYK